MGSARCCSNTVQGRVAVRDPSKAMGWRGGAAASNMLRENSWTYQMINYGEGRKEKNPEKNQPFSMKCHKNIYLFNLHQCSRLLSVCPFQVWSPFFWQGQSIHVVQTGLTSLAPAPSQARCTAQTSPIKPRVIGPAQVHNLGFFSLNHGKKMLLSFVDANWAECQPGAAESQNVQRALLR